MESFMGLGSYDGSRPEPPHEFDGRLDDEMQQEIDRLESALSSTQSELATVREELERVRSFLAQSDEALCALAWRRYFDPLNGPTDLFLAGRLAAIKMFRAALRAQRENARAVAYDECPICTATLQALPVGNLPSHTRESIPERVAYFVGEFARLSDLVEDSCVVPMALMDEALRALRCSVPYVGNGFDHTRLWEQAIARIDAALRERGE